MTETNPACDAVLDRLLAFLRGGPELSPEDRAHLAACPGCARALAAARSLQEELAHDEAPGDGDGERLEHVTRQAQAALGATRWRRAGIVFLAGLGVLSAWLLLPVGVLGWPEKIVIFFGMSLLLATIFGVFLIVRGLTTGTRGRPLYRRLGRGCWLAGVCAGLSEATGLSVWIIRAVFAGLVFVGKIGIPLYVMLALGLEVPPEDRGLLLRFKVRRLLARLAGRGPASGEAGPGR